MVVVTGVASVSAAHMIRALQMGKFHCCADICNHTVSPPIQPDAGRVFYHFHFSLTRVLHVQVVDELSDDETPQRLQEYGIRMVTPPERLGVTYNWNLVRNAAVSYPA